MDEPYQARSLSWNYRATAQDERTRRYVDLHVAMLNRYAELVKEGLVPDCRVCQEIFAMSRSCVKPVKEHFLVPAMAQTHAGAHRGSRTFTHEEREDRGF